MVYRRDQGRAQTSQSGSGRGAGERFGSDEAAETPLLQEPCHGHPSECNCHGRHSVVWVFAGF
jgi:hypothetical protein